MRTLHFLALACTLAVGCFADKDDDTSIDDTGDTTEDTGDTDTLEIECPVPALGVSTVGYKVDGDTASIGMLFTAGFTEAPPFECFSTGDELFGGSGIELSTPGGDPAASLPADYVIQPGNLVIEGIRNDPVTGDEHVFGDIFDGYEVSPDLSPVLAKNPVLDGVVTLCNVHGDCDDLAFTLEAGLPDW